MKLLSAMLLGLACSCYSQSPDVSSRTKVILLGTGTPNADPDRSGPSVAIVVDDIPYIVDSGPGVVRRATAAGIDVTKLSKLFLTHLHSDHTIGYADFILTPAVLERQKPVEVYGPAGIKNMNDHILAAYAEDLKIRISGLEGGDAEAYKVNVHEVSGGVVFQDERVKVTAFSVVHGSWPSAYGYKFETPDKKIVLSGDCTYTQSVIDQCNGCDILVHEVYSEDGYSRRPEKWRKYHAAFHTSSSQLAEIATKARPGLLVLYHQLIWDSSEEKLVKEITDKYKGRVVSGKDLDVF